MNDTRNGGTTLQVHVTSVQKMFYIPDGSFSNSVMRYIVVIKKVVWMQFFCVGKKAFQRKSKYTFL